MLADSLIRGSTPKPSCKPRRAGFQVLGLESVEELEIRPRTSGEPKRITRCKKQGRKPIASFCGLSRCGRRGDLIVFGSSLESRHAQPPTEPRVPEEGRAAKSAQWVQHQLPPMTALVIMRLWTGLPTHVHLHSSHPWEKQAWNWQMLPEHFPHSEPLCLWSS